MKALIILYDRLFVDQLCRAADPAGAGHEQRRPPAVFRPRHRNRLPLWQGLVQIGKPSVILTHTDTQTNKQLSVSCPSHRGTAVSVTSK